MPFSFSSALIFVENCVLLHRVFIFKEKLYTPNFFELVQNDNMGSVASGKDSYFAFYLDRKDELDACEYRNLRRPSGINRNSLA